MSYMEWEVMQDGTAFDIMNESGAFCTCDNEIDANRIVHCVNNYDKVVRENKKLKSGQEALEHALKLARDDRDNSY